jgi:hypothetical protein
VRIRLTLDIERAGHPNTWTAPLAEHVEHAPEVTVKGSPTDLDRAPQTDFDPPHRIGFLRNQEHTP